MEDNKNNALNSNLRYVFILIGVVALLLAYFLGFQKYKAKISDIDDEIDTLQSTYNDLATKNADRKNYKKQIKAFNTDIENYLSKFDGGITDESQIMDTYYLSNELGLFVSTMSIQQIDPNVNYLFGQIGSTNPDNAGALSGLDASYNGVCKSYNLILSGPYDQVKQYLTKTMLESGKRKVPTTVSFAYDTEKAKLIATISINEYAITGKDRNMQQVIIPDCNISTENIFFSPLSPVLPAQ